jgi:ribosome recycling factor
MCHNYYPITVVYFRVTKEHRENMAKSAKALFIKCRDSVRDVQNKYVKTVKNNTTISQDLAHNVQEQVGYYLICFLLFKAGLHRIMMRH